MMGENGTFTVADCTNSWMMTDASGGVMVLKDVGVEWASLNAMRS